MGKFISSLAGDTNKQVIDTKNNVASRLEVEDQRNWRYLRAMNADQAELLMAFLGLVLATASFILVAKRTDWEGRGGL